MTLKWTVIKTEKTTSNWICLMFVDFTVRLKCDVWLVPLKIYSWINIQSIQCHSRWMEMQFLLQPLLNWWCLLFGEHVININRYVSLSLSICVCLTQKYLAILFASLRWHIYRQQNFHWNADTRCKNLMFNCILMTQKFWIRWEKKANMIFKFVYEKTMRWFY